ncbi:glycosyltransferase [Candidatus Amesbacteria bacterium]|nr:glycosyltransferase [Candidatus Amesbacteria bacterium]
MNKSRLNLTIGIPAHNEQSNISNIIGQLLTQSGKSFTLERIVVFCDGCTDKTADIVKKIASKDKRVYLVDDERRLGKQGRLEQLFKMSQTDLVFVFDADVLPVDNSVIEQMAQQFFEKSVGLVGANSQPLPAQTLFGKLLNSWSHVWYLTRSNYRNGENIHNSRGCSLALSHKLASQVIFPPGISSDSQYLYLLSKYKKLQFRFVKPAIVYYRKPDNLGDYLIQIQRSAPDKNKLVSLFGDWVREEYFIPGKYKILGFLDALIHQPLQTIAGAVLNMWLSRLEGQSKYLLGESAWITSPSTKKAITINS